MEEKFADVFLSFHFVYITITCTHCLQMMSFILISYFLSRARTMPKPMRTLSPLLLFDARAHSSLSALHAHPSVCVCVIFNIIFLFISLHLMFLLLQFFFSFRSSVVVSFSRTVFCFIVLSLHFVALRCLFGEKMCKRVTSASLHDVSFQKHFFSIHFSFFLSL